MSENGITPPASPAIAAMTRYAESAGAITDAGLKELYRIATDLYAELNATRAEVDTARSAAIADRDAQIIAWLVKKGREEGESNREARTRGEVAFRLADKLGRGAVRPPLSGEVQRLRTRVAELEAQAEKVAAFCAQRAEYVISLRQFIEGGEPDYYRWTGHAEARRQLSQLLGLPVAWPAEDTVETDPTKAARMQDVENTIADIRKAGA